MLLYTPLTRKEVISSVALFFFGASLFSIGGYLSYVHIEPQRARTLARDELFREHLRKKYDYTFDRTPKARMKPFSRSKDCV